MRPIRTATLAGLVAALIAPCAQAADWEMAVTDRGGVTISYKSAPLVQGEYVAWGPKWAWGGVDLKTGSPADAGTPMTGAVPVLGIKLAGMLTKPAANVLRFAWELDAAKDLDDVIGLCMEFRLQLESAALGAGKAEPVLLDGGKGWRWQVGEGQAIAVTFAEPLADAYFERGNKGQIRCYLVAKKVAAGKKTVVMTVEIPKGGAIARSVAERYGPADTSRWFAGAMAWDESPVDLSFLNQDEKPAGKRGFVRAKGDQLVFADGTPARFWGGNIAAYAIFVADQEGIRKQARRIARLGFNLMRFHHHDSMGWVEPCVIDKKQADSQHLNDAALDKLDWWVKCLKDEGVYVWLDLHVGRHFKEGDGITQGLNEIQRQHNEGKGFCYYNTRLEELMREFNARYLSRVNPYTKLAYKDDPAVMGLLVTNENDLVCHFGNLMLGDKGNPVHNKVFMDSVKAFCEKTGLAPDQASQTWLPGPSKIYLNNQEHLFNASVLADLVKLGVRVPVATTNYWGDEGLCALAALTDGGIIDAHSYGDEEALGVNPRFQANYVPWIGAAQVAGKPLAITEWNVPYPARDRFTSPLYVAAIGALQGWDAPMIYNYSQRPMTDAPNGPDTWSTFYDPALAGVQPAAALLFRRGDVSPAKDTYCLKLDRRQFYDTALDPRKSAALRTLVERSKLTLGIPEVKELPWFKESVPEAGVKVVTDPAQDFIPAGENAVRSDTGEIARDWVKGIQTIDTPRTQAAHGWIGGETVALKDATIRVTTPKAAVVLSSLDGAPLALSRRILLTAIARVVPSPGNKMPYLSEPVTGTITLKSKVSGLKLAALAADGAEQPTDASMTFKDGAYAVTLPAAKGTHWFVLTAEAK